MCGIAGWLGPRLGPDVSERLERLLRHRGPDRQTTRRWDDCTFVHARLRIIDLSDAGEQPMSNEDGSVWVVFNGEIYNHRDLRKSLESKGHRFRGHSDTEVLPHLYEELGTRLVDELRGMFAFALFDLRRRRLVLARDRFGIKPLFFASAERRFAFASEIRALRQIPGIDLSPDRQAIRDYAAFFCMPAPRTLFAGIHAVEPGQRVVAWFDGEEIRSETRSYHRWTVAPDPSLDLETAERRADELIYRAVGRQLESEVRLGSLLSGGIDSSLVSEAGQRALGGGLHTFNVQFAEAEFDETWAARAVADHIGTAHRTLQMNDVSGSREHIAELFLQAGQPFADTSLLPMNAVSRLMREHVTVVHSGDGGDEGFGGYQTFWETTKIGAVRALPRVLLDPARWLARPVAALGTRLGRWADRFNYIAATDDVTAIQDQHMWLTRDEHRRLCRFDEGEPVRRFYEPRWEHRLPPRSSATDRLSALLTEISLRLIMPNDFLFKVDTASMKESLEVRVPLLDEDLIQFALTLPHELKVRRGETKRVLRKLAHRRLPRAVAEKPKQGFAIPVTRWVGRDFKQHVQETLLNPASRLTEHFDPDVYQPWVRTFCDDLTRGAASRLATYQRAFMLFALSLFLDS